jgi:hypothetical protein
MARPNNDPTRPFDDEDEQPYVPTGTEVVKSAPKSSTLVSSTGQVSLTNDQLKQMSFSDLVAELGEDSVDVVLGGQDQYGPILEDKGRLVGVPLLIVKWNFHPGKGGDFVSLWILTQTGERYIVNDGSTGIKEQLQTYTAETGRNAMLRADRGFSRSDYVHPEHGPSTTFYIDTKLTA